MRSIRPALALGLLLSLLVIACSGGGVGGDGGVNGTGGGGSASTDPVLAGRWDGAFFGRMFDLPNTLPSLDVRGGKAHLLYRSKTLNSTYLVFDGAGGSQEIAFPQGTKDPGRVTTLPDGSCVVVLQNVIDGSFSAYRQQEGVVTALPAPTGPGVTVRPPEVATLGSAPLVAFASATGMPTVVVLRLGANAWESVGRFPASSTVSRVRLASDGQRAVLMSLEGPGTRVIRSWDGSAWRELSGLPASNGASALPSVVVDGPRTYFLEWQEGAQQAVVWVHDGTSWSEHARSKSGEGFHGLVLHGGALYTMISQSPNFGGPPATFGFARLDRGSVVRGAAPQLPDGSRFDSMDYEESALVSRDQDLWLAYQEAGSAPTVRLLHLAR
ncbi:MAG: hypothetical protein AB1938_25065 [Myxococcota bacterium]